MQFLKGLILPVLAGSVIILALLVGVARLLLPQVPQYRENIQELAAQATGFSVEFGQIGAGVSRYGPELRLQNTRIVVPEENLVGKAFAIWMSWDSALSGLPVAWGRIGQTIE